MAIERRIDTATWDDPWFADLAPDGKLLFLYLLTNRRTTSCGAFEITLRAMAFETGIAGKRVSELLASFGDRAEWFETEQIIFIKNFYRRQNPNPSFTTNAQKTAAALPAPVRGRVYEVYPELMTGCPDDSTPDDRVSPPSVQGVPTPETVLELEPVREPEPDKAEAQRAVAREAPSAIAVEIAETLVTADWINDEVADVAREVDRLFGKVPSYSVRDGPGMALLFVNWRGYVKKPPDNWSMAWLKWLRKEVKDDDAKATTPHRNGHGPGLYADSRAEAPTSGVARLRIARPT